MSGLPLHYQISSSMRPEPLHKGLDRSIHQLLGRYRRRKGLMQSWQKQAEEVLQQTSQLQKLSDQELKQQLMQLKKIYRRRKKGPADSPREAFALITEAAFRSMGMRPYEVQILAAIALLHGSLVEMATGEGKSLTACFPAILTAWEGRPCHVITANDYLAERDAKELTPLYNFCGISVSWVDGTMAAASRKQSYSTDVVYTTSKELLADFLRDRLQMRDCQTPERQLLQQAIDPCDQSNETLVMRGIDTAIIDEADSVLIDEAVTPLIIAKPQANHFFLDAIQAAQTITAELTLEKDYRVDSHYREISLTKAGATVIARKSETLSGLFQNESHRNELILTTLRAREFYHRDNNYVIVDDQVIIIDEFTGRMMPGRSWQQGLHQAIEARENLPLSNPNETLARLSFQQFFRLFRNLSGLTGTAREVANEFWDVYRLAVVSIPTHRPCQRKIFKSRYYSDQNKKWREICTEIVNCQATGQPVLVGTRSLSASKKLAEMLDQRQLSYQLLNALNHRQEAKIIATAGQRGEVTIATNMAGRGADIKLGHGVAQLGGLHVILSEPHESKRIDRQLLGRGARQGDPGSVRTYASLDDELLQKNDSGLLLTILGKRLACAGEGRLFFNKLLNQAERSAQKIAFQQRKSVLETDNQLNDALSFAPSTTGTQ
ncbi:MAG: DEAD/DEAH box helicase [Desulfuromusa sp.]|jgi:preprotein translocase subunit SecA|nr:DEAD/DEAH box helicase [Desulfuromusa sp.]